MEKSGACSFTLPVRHFDLALENLFGNESTAVHTAVKTAVNTAVSTANREAKNTCRFMFGET